MIISAARHGHSDPRDPVVIRNNGNKVLGCTDAACKRDGRLVVTVDVRSVTEAHHLMQALRLVEGDPHQGIAVRAAAGHVAAQIDTGLVALSVKLRERTTAEAPA